MHSDIFDKIHNLTFIVLIIAVPVLDMVMLLGKVKSRNLYSKLRGNPVVSSNLDLKC